MSIETRAHERGHAVEYILDGEEISRCNVFDLRMHVGGAVLRMGGIGDVRTQEQHRRHGYARQVLGRAMAFMQEQGYDLSTLFGISDFYPRWGFAPIFGDTRVTLATKDAARARPAYPLRRLRRDEAEITLELYRRNNALRTGALARRAGRWRGFVQGSRWRRPVNVYGAFDGNQRLMGYVVLDRSPSEAIIAEVGYRTPEVFGTLLSAGVRQARRAKAEQMQVLLPADHPFADWCRLLGCQATTHYHRTGGAMGRIINLHGCLAKLAPELSRRVSGASLQWRGRLLIETDIGEVTLRIGQRAVSLDDTGKLGAADACLQIAQPALTQLIFGYRSPAELVGTQRSARSPAATLRGGPIELLDALFPRGFAYVWRPDYF